MSIAKPRPAGPDPTRRAASVALFLAAAAAATAAGCGTAVGPAAPAAAIPGRPAAGALSDVPAKAQAAAPASAPADVRAKAPAEAPAPDVSEEPVPARERAAALRRVAAVLERSGADAPRYAAATREVERYLAARPGERDDAVLALVARLLGECQRLDADLEKVVRERNELKTLLQRLKDLEMQMEEKRRRLR